MRRSFVRLVLWSVLAAWVGGFAVLYTFTSTLRWTEGRAQVSGIFLIRDLLGEAQPEQRARRLAELQPHTDVPLSLMTPQDVASKLGRAIAAGEAAPLRVSKREEWYFMAFEGDHDVLAAGPVNPSLPFDVFPMGVALAVLIVPAIAGAVALQLERALATVERASDALATGELGARVEDARGPSVEIAARFNAMATRIEELVRSREELVQAVSHELGSPLSRLRFHLELLEREPEADRERRLSVMTRELDALDELVAELLGYVETADLRVSPVTFDPSVVLADLAEIAALERSEEHEVDVRVVAPAQLEVTADQRLFQRAVENLLRNAMRHAERQVLLDVSTVEGGVRVAVHDDGPGIPEAMREKVALPFVRIDEHRSRKTGGAGLGLAIVRRILQRHGGRLEIDDSPLGGALVATVWPCGTPSARNKLQRNAAS